MSRTFIRILDAQVYAHHGVTDGEQDLGGRYSFDIELHVDVIEAAHRDDIAQTVDYSRVYHVAADMITRTRRRLIEAVALDVATSILGEWEQVKDVVVRLRKIGVPIQGVVGSVEVELRGSRSELLTQTKSSGS